MLNMELKRELLLVLSVVAVGQAKPQPSCDSVDDILEKLRASAQRLVTYQCEIEYVEEQPLLESRLTRRGHAYYRREEDRSFLRINFETLVQDEQEAEVDRQHVIFDGVWLTRIDYELKSIQKRQLAEPNRPMDAFELASDSMPIIGFSANEDLKKEFRIQVAPAAAKNPTGHVQLNLEVLPESRFRQSYQSLEFWIDRKLWLPVRVDAITSEGDITRIRFLQAKVNEKVDIGLFEVKPPKGFGKPEIIPLRPN